MSLGSYDELRASVAAWLARDGDTSLAAQAKDFIALTETDLLRRLRLRLMEARATTTVDAEYIGLPTGFLEMRNFQLNTQPVRVLNYTTPHDLDSRYGGLPGCPRHYSVVANQIQLGPVPDGSYPAEMLYYKAFDRLGPAAQTNPLFAANPDIYLYGALLQAAPFLGADSRIPVWGTLYARAVDDLIQTDRDANWSGSPLVTRPSGPVV